VTQPHHNILLKTIVSSSSKHQIVASSSELRQQVQHDSHCQRQEQLKMNVAVPAAQAVKEWVTEHPYQTAMHVANGVILCTPAAVTVPIFSALGFTAAGPAAGTFLGSHLHSFVTGHSYKLWSRE
jgi:hypothetical protein